MLFPLLPAAAMLVVSDLRLRRLLVRSSAALLALASVVLAWRYAGGAPTFFAWESHGADLAVFAGDLLLSLYLLRVGVQHRRPLVILLVLAQLGLLGWAEFSGRLIKPEHTLYLDNLSLIMALIIGLIGGLIAIFSLPYMRGYHHHFHDVPDRRKGFFFVFFAFLSAMYGIVFANNLTWLFFCWEVTTVCSFWMIGYPRSAEATANAFRALQMNLLGGLGFALAIAYLVGHGMPVGLQELTAVQGPGLALALVPAALLCFAGLTKSAQLPFSSWLLGAMVAPTPVSALLHSSTMVKAGVFLIIKMAPLLHGQWLGIWVSLVGGVTFLLTSCIAVSQNNAKRVLAYSTVANLGLVVACAGVGTAAALWAAVLLVIFHALAKGLLFLTVGAVEHRIDSRDIEDMDGLVARLPALAVIVLIGIAGMYLAPFGMLISKWAALQAFVDANPLLAVLLAFGSAPTLFFWSKWMGKIIAVPLAPIRQKGKMYGDEWVALLALAALTILACGFFPAIGARLIDPWLQALTGAMVPLTQNNMLIMVVMLALLLGLPASLLLKRPTERPSVPYLGGANLDGGPDFRGSLEKRTATMRNYYLAAYFDETRLSRWGGLLNVALMALMLWWR